MRIAEGRLSGKGVIAVPRFLGDRALNPVNHRPNERCPICQATAADVVHQDRRREYLFCRNCKLIFVPDIYFLSAEEEKKRYDLHVNDPQDSRYRRFLGRLFHPMERILPSGSRGLDFGSGPGPTLSIMFEEAGHSVAVFDPFYARNPKVFEEQYDFITATEVLEHIQRPRDELRRIWDCLKPGGWFGVMTKLVLSPDRFSRWHYKEDPTHLRFFSRATVRWMADRWGAALAFVAADTFLFHKRSKSPLGSPSPDPDPDGAKIGESRGLQPVGHR